MIVPGHNNSLVLPVSFSESNRIGKFNLLDGRIEHDALMCQALLSVCSVILDEPHESGRGRFIMAASQLFEPLEEGEEIPEYRIEAVCDADFADEEKRRLSVRSGRFRFYATRQNIVRVPPVAMTTSMH